MSEESKSEMVEDNVSNETQIEVDAQVTDIKEETIDVPPKDELTILRETIKELEEKALRNLAEHENYRKAMLKESDKKVNVAVKNMVTKFLSVMGVFSQGIKAAETSSDIEGVLSGMKMVETMFNGALNDIGVKEVEAKEGIPFDPNFHQPLSRVESADHPDNTILNVIAKGYVLNGLLVQPAMVVVSYVPTPKKEDSSDGNPTQSDVTVE